MDSQTSCKPAIRIENLGKCYPIFAAPRLRLQQAVMAGVWRAARPLARSWRGESAAPRYYREFWALRDIAFTVAAGETVGIIGANGSGKSTLLQLLCGTLTPTIGCVEICGRVAGILELGSGFNPDFSGRENIYLNAAILGLTRHQIDARIDDIVAFADIGDFIEQPVRTYSSGMSMRLAFAVIAHVDADVMIIDEALAIGDAYFQQKCMRWLRRFREQGTLIFCSHDTAAVMSLCDKAIWLDAGAIRATGTAKDVCEAYIANTYARSMGLEAPAVRGIRRAAAVPDATSERALKIDLPQVIEVFAFDENAAQFGTGAAAITDVRLLREDGREPGLLMGGEAVKLVVTIRTNAAIEDAIVGFHVKDRLGQPLFGDNSHATYRGEAVCFEAGQTVNAAFVFELPCLQTGDYTITAAIASGTPERHIQHHRAQDVLAFKVHSPLRNGMMMAIPMRSIVLGVHDGAAGSQCRDGAASGLGCPLTPPADRAPRAGSGA